MPTRRLQEAMNRIEPRQLNPSDGRDNKSPDCLGKDDGQRQIARLIELDLRCFCSVRSESVF